MFKILIAEDEISLAVTLKEILTRQSCQVKTVYNGSAAYKLARAEVFDLIVLDIVMPRLSGLVVARWLREKNIETPVMFLTNRKNQEDICQGMSYADAYLTKPFSSMEFIARVKALLSRPPRSRQNSLTFKQLQIDVDSRTVLRGNKQIPLRKKEFDILLFLAINNGFTVSREKLLNNLWGVLKDPYPGTIDVHISNIRKKIDGGFPDKIIKTVHGIGYMLNG